MFLSGSIQYDMSYLEHHPNYPLKEGDEVILEKHWSFDETAFQCPYLSLHSKYIGKSFTVFHKAENCYIIKDASEKVYLSVPFFALRLIKSSNAVAKKPLPYLQRHQNCPIEKGNVVKIVTGWLSEETEGVLIDSPIEAYDKINDEFVVINKAVDHYVITLTSGDTFRVPYHVLLVLKPEQVKYWSLEEIEG